MSYWPHDPEDVKLSVLSHDDAMSFDVFDQHSLIMFDGNKAHETESYSGEERMSIVFYTIPKSQMISTEDRSVLKTMGFQLPPVTERKRRRGIAEGATESYQIIPSIPLLRQAKNIKDNKYDKEGTNIASIAERRPGTAAVAAEIGVGREGEPGMPIPVTGMQDAHENPHANTKVDFASGERTPMPHAFSPGGTKLDVGSKSHEPMPYVPEFPKLTSTAELLISAHDSGQLRGELKNVVNAGTRTKCSLSTDSPEVEGYASAQASLENTVHHPTRKSESKRFRRQSTRLLLCRQCQSTSLTEN